MVTDYSNNSRYYCIEYLIPLSEVIFDLANPPESELEKTLIFLVNAIVRLYKEWRHSSFICDDNLILRLEDDVETKKEWFVNAEELHCKIKIEMGDIKWQIQQNALEYHIVL